MFDGESGEMQQAWIAGEPAALDTAIEEAAKLLTSSRYPLVAGLGTDIAGARAAITLADRIGAVIDHMNADALLRDLDVVRSSGVLVTTPSEAHVRADTLLLVGPGLAETWLELPRRLFEAMRPNQNGAALERRVYSICPGRNWAIPASGEAAVVAIGGQPGEIPALLAALRVRVAGRPTGKTRISSSKLDEVAAGLKKARFGVAIWSAATVDALTIEMLCGLLNELNAATRFFGLPLAPADNAIGVMQACAWMIGLPVRAGFGRTFPQHDPWLFNSQRIVAGGEADCVLWISAYRAATPPWRGAVPTIALTGRKANFDMPPRVHIAVGCPGDDHAGVEHLPSTGSLALVEAKKPSSAISVADAIARIISVLPGAGELPC